MLGNGSGRILADLSAIPGEEPEGDDGAEQDEGGRGPSNDPVTECNGGAEGRKEAGFGCGQMVEAIGQPRQWQKQRPSQSPFFCSQ